MVLFLHVSAKNAGRRVHEGSREKFVRHAERDLIRLGGRVECELN